MRRLDVLFLSNVHPSSACPAKGRFNRLMLDGLAERHDIRRVIPVSWLERLGAGSRRDSADLIEPTWYYPPKLLRTHYGGFLRRSISGAVRRFVAERRPDVVLSYWAYPDGQAAADFAAGWNVPFVAMTGGSDVLLQAADARRKLVIYDVLHRADRVIAIGDHLAERLRENGITVDRVRTLYRGVDYSLFHPSDRSAARERLGLPLDVPIVIAVGRLVPVKAHSVLVDAFQRVVQDVPDARLCIVGDGPLRGSLERQIAAAGLGDRIALPGGCDHDTLSDWYRAADVVALPSLSEGVPNVLLEAIACGARIVASDVGSVRNILDDTHDRLVAAGDAQRLADALQASLTEGPVNALRSFRPPTLESATDDLSDVLLEAVDAYRCGQPRQLETVL